MRVQRGIVAQRPLRVLIHSEPKAGKSHLACGAPHAIHLDCEQGTLGFDVDRVDVRRWEDYTDALEQLSREDHDYRLISTDTLDALERHLCEYCARKLGVREVSEAPFGRGWAMVEAEWTRLLEQLRGLQDRRGISLVFLAHSMPTTTSTPDGDAWAEWRLRVNRKTQGVWLGWVEEILFLHQQVKLKKKSRVAEGSRRVLETREAAAWQAGSRRLRVEQIVLPDSTPAACWAALREAYLDGMPPRPTNRGSEEREGDSPSAPEASEPDSRGRPPEGPPASGPREASGPATHSPDGRLWEEIDDVAYLREVRAAESNATARTCAERRLEQLGEPPAFTPRDAPRGISGRPWSEVGATPGELRWLRQVAASTSQKALVRERAIARLAEIDQAEEAEEAARQRSEHYADRRSKRLDELSQSEYGQPWSELRSEARDNLAALGCGLIGGQRGEELFASSNGEWSRWIALLSHEDLTALKEAISKRAQPQGVSA